MRTTHFMNKLLTFTHCQCYINNNSFNEYQERLMSQLTLNQKLTTLQPLVDMNLFESSLEYRNKILCLLAEQENTLNLINKEFGHEQPPSFSSEKKFVLGYN